MEVEKYGWEFPRGVGSISAIATGVFCNEVAGVGEGGWGKGKALVLYITGQKVNVLDAFVENLWIFLKKIFGDYAAAIVERRGMIELV